MILTIKSLEIDKEASELVKKVFERMTPRWKAALPPRIVIIISSKSFDKVSELKEFRKAQEKAYKGERIPWKFIQVVCTEFYRQEAVFWVHYDHKSMWQPPAYYFQKELYAVIAKLIWCLHKNFQNLVKKEITGMMKDSSGAAYLIFRDTFSRFFLNPEYLQEKKEGAWALITHLDKCLQKRKVFSGKPR